MRKNPMIWEEDETAEGVLAPFEGVNDIDTPALLGLSEMGGNRSLHEVKAHAAANPAVYTMLGQIAEALQAALETGRAWRRRLDHLNETERDLLIDALGSGEVSVVIAGAGGEEGEAQISETVLPGVWIGRAADTDGKIRAHWVEVGDCPRAVRECAVDRPQKHLGVEALVPPRGAMNVMSVLSEIRERAGEWTPGTPNHVLNFTLFPMTPADTAFLAETLGEVGVSIISGGYGTARVIMTAVRHVWAVQYVNGIGTTILDTIEIGDIPQSVLAAKEDFADSADRLADIQQAYAP